MLGLSHDSCAVSLAPCDELCVAPAVHSILAHSLYRTLERRVAMDRMPVYHWRNVSKIPDLCQEIPRLWSRYCVLLPYNPRTQTRATGASVMWTLAPADYGATSMVAPRTAATGWVSAPELEPVALKPATGTLMDNARVVVSS
jgi:hypothetical protein